MDFSESFNLVPNNAEMPENKSKNGCLMSANVHLELYPKLINSLLYCQFTVFLNLTWPVPLTLRPI